MLANMMEEANGMRRVVLYLSFLFLFSLPLRVLSTFGGKYNITVSWLLGLCFGILWMYSTLNQKETRNLHLYHIILYLNILIAMISVTWSKYPIITLSTTARLLSIFLISVALWDLYNTRRRAIVGISFLLGGIAILYFISVAEFVISDGVYRNVAFGLNPNFVGSISVLGISILLLLSFELKKYRLIYLLVVFFGVFTIFLSGSRTAVASLVILSIYCVVVILTTKERLTQLIVVGSLILTAGISWALLPSRINRRLISIITLIESQSLGNRGDIWLKGFEIFLENPLFGTGSGTFYTIVGRYAHSIYLSTLVELGVIGFILFVLLPATVYISAVRYRKYFWSSVPIAFMLVFTANDYTYMTGHILLILVLSGVSSPYSRH